MDIHIKFKEEIAMAIIKSIELENGITVSYHRVVSVNNVTNVSSIIEVG